MKKECFVMLVLACLTLVAWSAPSDSNTSLSDRFIQLNDSLQAHSAKAEFAIAGRYALKLGQLFYEQGAFTKALNFLQLAADNYRKANDDNGLALVLLEQGRVAYFNKQMDQAYRYLEEALFNFEALNNKARQAEVKAEIGHLHEKEGNYAKALVLQKEALALAFEENELAIQVLALENLGSIYEDQSKFDSAFYFFSRALKLNESQGDTAVQVVLLNNLGDVFRKRNLIDSALHYSTLALALASRNGFKYQQSSAYRDLGKIYAQAGEYEQAYAFNEKGRRLYEELFAEESRQQMVLLQNLFELENKNAQIQNLEKQQTLEQWVIVALSLVVVLVVVLTLVFLSRQKLKLSAKEALLKKANALQMQALENSKLNEERLKIELKHKKLQEEYLSLELDNQHKALSSRMLQLIEKNKLLEEIRAKLNTTLKSIPQEHQKDLKNLTHQIALNFTGDDEWHQFQKSFEQIHSSFFETLKNKCPEISANDLRICALMRINLNSDQIASILGITADSLRVSRYRLRKKLRLKREDNLTEFILNI